MKDYARYGARCDLNHSVRDTEAVVEAARKQRRDLQTGYEESLRDREVSPHLLVGVKNVLENLRSALDYSAVAVFDRHVAGHLSSSRVDKARRDVHFPIYPDDDKFTKAIGRLFPQLQQRVPALVDELRQLQPFSSDENRWLGQFADLCNEGKHQRLAPQKREESITRVTVESARVGGAVSWTAGAVRFGSGVRILGVPVDPRTQMPVPDPSVKVKREVWVDFRFETTGASVLPFLDTCLSGTRDAVNRVSRFL